MKKFFTLILLVTQLFVTTLAQTDQKNLDKYWAYRERLKKNFLKIGNDNGESIPISARSIGFANHVCFSGAGLTQCSQCLLL